MITQIASKSFQEELKPQIPETNPIVSAHLLEDLIQKAKIPKWKQERMKQDVTSIIEFVWQERGEPEDSFVKPLERIANAFEKSVEIPAKKRALAREYLAGVRGEARDAEQPKRKRGGHSLEPTRVPDDCNRYLSKFMKVSETFRKTPVPKDLQGAAENLACNVAALFNLKHPLQDFDRREIKQLNLEMLYNIQEMKKIMEESTRRIQAGESLQNCFVYAEGK